MTVSFGMYKVGTEYRINMGEEVLHFTFLLCVLQFFLPLARPEGR